MVLRGDETVYQIRGGKFVGSAGEVEAGAVEGWYVLSPAALSRLHARRVE